MMMQKDATLALVQGTSAPNGKQPRFLDADPPRPAPLGRLHTDDEARLAAEIEKLR